MCFGGGGGGASDYAAENEARRQAQIAQSTAAIESMFNPQARQAQYNQYGQDVLNRNMMQISEDKARADRELAFALARKGLTGSSQHASSAAQLGQNYDEGVLTAQRYAQEQSARLAQQDQQAKSNLLSQAQTGLDATSAATLAQSALRNNLDLAANQENLANFGNLLSNIAVTAQQGAAGQGAADARRVLADEDRFASYIPASSGSGYSGRSTRIGG